MPSILQMWKLKFQDIKFIHPHAESMYPIMNKMNKISKYFQFSKWQGWDSVTRALSLFPSKGLRSDVNIVWILRPSHLLLIWDFPPLAKAPSAISGSLKGVWHAVEQAQSAPKHMFPARHCHLSADSCCCWVVYTAKRETAFPPVLLGH